jgi:hypothetical protein
MTNLPKDRLDPGSYSRPSVTTAMTQTDNLDPFICPYSSVLVFQPFQFFFRRQKVFSAPSQTRGIPDVPNDTVEIRMYVGAHSSQLWPLVFYFQYYVLECITRCS